MSNRLSRDTEDAAKVLTALRDKYHPREALPEKLSAAEDLRAKLVNVATGIRKWTVKSQGEDSVITLQDAGTVHVHTDEETGQIQLSLDGASWTEAPLEYDPLAREWVGTSLDSDVEILPGEPRPHQAALVALAAAIVRLVGEPAK